MDAIIRTVFPWSDVRSLLREIADRSDKGEARIETGTRKALAMVDSYSAFSRAGVTHDEALAGAWYTAVSAKELSDSRLLVDELFRARFSMDPAAPLIPCKVLPETAHPVAGAIHALADSGLNLWLTGEPAKMNAGAGKSWTLRKVVEALEAGRDLGPPLVVAGNNSTDIDAFIGHPTLTPHPETQQAIMTQLYGPVIQAMREGRPVIIEEPSAIIPGRFMVMQQPLEERSILHPDTGETVIAEPGFLVLCADNTHGQGDGPYMDRFPQDSAFLDRFQFVEMGPLPKLTETAIIRERAALSGISIS